MKTNPENPENPVNPVYTFTYRNILAEFWRLSRRAPT